MAQGYCNRCGKFIKRIGKTGICRECYLSPENSEERSEQVKEALRDPEVLQRKSEATKQAWARGAYDTEEYHKKRSEVAKKIVSDPQMRQRISKGVRAAWERGDFDADEIQQKKSEALKAKWQEPEYRKRLLAARKDPEFRQQLSEIRKASWQEPEYREQQLASRQIPEHRLAISERATARWSDPEEREKQSERALAVWADPEQRAARTGENHYNWQGGISFEPYGPEFNDELKQYIRARDNHRCVLCSILEDGQAHHCHHIDYDKTNNDPSNLITLCCSCHLRTNYNRRFWRTILAPVAMKREKEIDR